MTPVATGAARPSTPRAAPRRSRSSVRPALRLVERAPSTRRRRLGRRASIWLSVAMVAGSLLAVVAGDDLVTQGQIRLASINGQLSKATATNKTEQVAVAQKAAPTRVVRIAEAQGLVATPQVNYLPEVPLDVPLPAPQTGPAAPPTRR